MAVVDAESWGEYVTIARKISTLTKWRPNNYYGLSRALRKQTTFHDVTSPLVSPRNDT